MKQGEHMRWSRAAMTTSVAVAAFAVTASLSLPSANAVSDPAGTIETSPIDSTLRGSFSILGGGEKAWAVSGTIDDVLQTSFISTTTRTPITVDHPELVSAESAFQYIAADHALGLDFLSFQLASIDLSNGHVAVNDAAGFSAYSGLQLLGGTSTGWVVSADDVVGTHYFVQPYAGGSPTEMTQPGDTFRVVASCASGSLVETTELLDLGSGPQPQFRLRLFATGGGSSRVVAEGGDFGVQSATCSSSTIAWVSGADSTLSHQPVGGGTTVTHAPIDADPWSIVSAAGGVIGLTNINTGAGATWSGAGDPIVLSFPAGYSAQGVLPSALTDGTPAVLMALADVDSQGILEWFTGGASPASTVAAPFQTLGELGLAASAGTAYDQLSTDFLNPPADDRTSPLFVRSVGGSPLAFGTSSSFLPRASSYLGSSLDRASRFRQGLGVSGARVAVPSWPSPTAATQELTLLDNGTRTAGVTLPGRAAVVSQSGPYTAVVPGDSKLPGFVTLPDGHVVAALPTLLSQVVMNGSLAVYTATDGSVWVRDVAKAASSSNPRKVMTACGTKTVVCSRRLASWGKTIAAATLRNDAPFGPIKTVAVTGGTIRSLTALTGALAVSLRGSLLMYVTQDTTTQVRLADLSLATPASVLVADDTLAPVGPVVLDGHVLTWLTYDTIKAAPVPAGVDHATKPRLLGMFGATVLGRTGGALTLPWKPAFDLDAVINSWTLTIKKGSTVVKTFTGSSPTSGIRGISWDGKSTGGKIVAPGAYTWTLTGSNPDGALTAASGSGVATGSLQVVTTAKSKLTIAATPKVVTFGSAGVVSGKLTKLGTTVGLGNEPVQLFSRKPGTATWTLVATRWTGATGAVSFSVRPTATTVYQLRHAKTGQSFASTSTAVTMATKFKLTATYSVSTVRHGGAFRVSGSLAPSKNGATVTVQRRFGTVWKPVKKLTITSGKYTGVILVGNTTGAFSYRVVKAADPTHKLAITVTKKIKVT